MTTTLATRTVTFPRVNLLPPEIEEEARFRSVRALLGLAVLGAGLVVGGLYWTASGQVSQAQDDLTASRAEQTRLNAEVTKYAEVPVAYARVAAAEASLSLAMDQEIRYSYILNDLALTIPSSVWLTEITVNQQVDADAASPLVGSWGTPSVSKISFQGLSDGETGIAAWLDALAKNEGYTDPYFTKAELSDEYTGLGVYTFDSDVSLTDQVLSNRYSQKAGK